MNTTTKIETVKKLELEPGDILHVAVGGEIRSGEHDAVYTWAPARIELDDIAQQYREAMPDGVTLIVTHQYVNERIVRQVDRQNTSVVAWPPKNNFQ